MLRLLPVVLVLLIAACEQEPRSAPPADRETVPERTEATLFRIDGTLDFLREDGTRYATIDIEIAETEQARREGLMNRTSIPPDTGMLFLFDREELQSFWMANTPVSLDIIFADADSQIVHVAKYARPFSPDPVPSRRPARYVVEVQAGYADRHGIIEGDRIRWHRNGDAPEV